MADGSREFRVKEDNVCVCPWDQIAFARIKAEQARRSRAAQANPLLQADAACFDTMRIKESHRKSLPGKGD